MSAIGLPLADFVRELRQELSKPKYQSVHPSGMATILSALDRMMDAAEKGDTCRFNSERQWIMRKVRLERLWHLESLLSAKRHPVRLADIRASIRAL
jgi:hypothetical protein